MGKRKPGHGQDKDQAAAFAALEALYEQLPVVRCQGLCADSCASMGMTVLEQRHIRARTGKSLPLAHAGHLCEALTMLRQCGVYEARPMICRIWGMVAAMRCDYGCVPEGGFLSDAQAYEFLARVFELAGDHDQAEAYRAPFRELPAEQIGRALRGMQKERDLAFLAKSRRPNLVRVGAPGRIVPKGG